MAETSKLATLLALLLVASVKFAVASVSECGPVVDKVIRSPDSQKAAHLMNQYCSAFVGVSNNPYWVVVGDHVSRAGGGEPVTLADESEVAFKTWDYPPSVSWRDDQSLVISLDQVSTIGKSLHSIGPVTIVYQVGSNLSEENVKKKIDDDRQRFLKNMYGVGWADKYSHGLDGIYEAQWKAFVVFNNWAKRNAQ